MDSFDTKILNALQSNANISNDVLGQEVGLSASACQRRIKKLKQHGIIEKNVAILNRESLTNLVTVIVDIMFDKGGEATLDALTNQLANVPQVQQIYYMSGEVDLIVIFTCQDLLQYEQLTRDLFMTNNAIKRFTSKVAIKPVKTSTHIPLTT